MTHLAVDAAIQSAPPRWQRSRLKAICQRVDERRGTRDFHLLSLASAGHLLLRSESGDRQQPAVDNLPRYLVVQPGDLVVNPMWLSGGSIAVSDKRGAVSPDYRVFRAAKTLDPRFLHYLLRSSAYFDQYRLYTRADTTFDRRVQQHDLDDLPVLVPPLDEQRRIAAFLDDQVMRIDRAIDLRLQQQSLLSIRHRSALVDAARQTGATRPGAPWFPKKASWRVVPLKAVVFCFDGRRIPLSAEQRATRPGPYRYFGASAVVDHIDDYLFDGEYVLIGEDGASLENPDFDVVQQVTGKFWVNNHAHVLAARDDVDGNYLAHYLRSADRAFLISGATRAKITQDDLMNLPIVVPSFAEQLSMVTDVEQARQVGHEASTTLGEGLSLLQERKRALITAVVTGRFDVSTASVRAAAAVMR